VGIREGELGCRLGAPFFPEMPCGPGLGHFGDTDSATGRFGDGTFRRWWSRMFYTKKVFSTYAFHEHLVAGNSPPRKLSRHRICDERILRVVQRYVNYSVTKYLREIAHNFQMD